MYDKIFFCVEAKSERISQHTQKRRKNLFSELKVLDTVHSSRGGKKKKINNTKRLKIPKEPWGDSFLLFECDKLKLVTTEELGEVNVLIKSDTSQRQIYTRHKSHLLWGN